MIKKFISMVICTVFAISAFSVTAPSTSAYTSSNEIDDGYYYLTSKCAPDKCIDSEGGETMYEGYNHNLHMWEYLGNDNQIFYIEYVKTVNGVNYYSIRNKLTGYYMDVKGGEVYNCNNIWEYEWNGSDAQLFKFVKQNGYYVIKSKLSNNYALDVCNASSDNGANVQLYEYSYNNKAQLWKVNYIYSNDAYISYKTVSLDSFSTIDEWEKALLKAQLNAVGFNTKYAYNYNNELVNYGQMIVGKEVVEYRTIPVTYYVYGNKVTEEIQLPSKIKFKLHAHNIEQLVYFDVSKLTTTQYCQCGEWHYMKWEVPYPD